MMPSDPGALGDWLAVSRLQPLPQSITPVHDETVTSYLMRLAQANSMNGYHLIDYLRGSTSPRIPVPPEVVITTSGQPAQSMRYAILELCSAQELASMSVTGRPRPHSSITFVKCTRCTRARGIYHPVTCWRRAEDVICRRHRRWIAGPTQIDLAGFDDILQANRQHRRLIRRHGRFTVHRAFEQAHSIVDEWATRGYHRGQVDRLMHRFHGPSWRVPPDDSTLQAAKYPPTVALTRLLASPFWKALALDVTGNAMFVQEVRRTAEPDYIWESSSYSRYTDPLRRMFREEPEERALEARQAEHRRAYNLPEPLSDTIGSDQL
ncbi:hypothetical protein AB0L65_22875 [Nonomuraea sp. NPDC052116]|uniref:hypothetical protein n=1 Tax=Nonomuraea sp. NPDC052116 TaxID=3155665 RepID=UPI003445A35C